MYELLNIKNKLKGNRFYYCNFLVTNKSFAIQLDKYTIISTQKQEIERFIKHYYSKGTNVRERWDNKSYYSSNSKRKYNTLLQQLKRL